MMLQKTNTLVCKSLLLSLLIWMTFWLTGCFHFTQPDQLLGKTEAETLTALGNPTAIVELPGGEGGRRFQYSGQPWSDYVWNLDLNSEGTVIQARQVLQPFYFNQVPLDGSWGVEEVLREFGPPAFIDAVWSWEGDIWNYRWREPVQRMFFHIYFDRNMRVRRAHVSIDFSAERYEWPN